MESLTIKFDHILIDRRWHDVRSFRAEDCDTERYLQVAKAGEKLAVSKGTKQRFHVERCNLKTLNEVEGKEQYHVKNSNWVAALGN
jgi:hypothetical protein